MTTTEPNLIERYVSAVSRRVPAGARQDVAEELRASLADAVDRAMDGGASREDAQEAVVTDLGEPGALAAQYGGRPQYLIGPGFFTDYAVLLRLLLWIVVPLIGVVILLAEGLGGAGPLAAVLAALGSMVQVGVWMAFWVTLVFALLERSGATPRTKGSWTAQDLPEVTDRRIGLFDTAASISAVTVTIWALLWSRDHWLVSGGTAADGSTVEVPFLNPDLWDFWMPLVIFILVLNIALEVGKYRTGHWTVTLAVLTTVLSVAFAGIVLWLWSAGPLVNPAAEFPEAIESLLGFIPAVVLVAEVIEVGGAWRALRRRAPST